MITVDELEALPGLALRLVAGQAGAGRTICAVERGWFGSSMQPSAMASACVRAVAQVLPPPKLTFPLALTSVFGGGALGGGGAFGGGGGTYSLAPAVK